MPVVINTKSRAELKAFFKTGKRPTEVQFGDLIDAMSNAKDDNLVKANASPLRLQAEQSGATAIQKVVEFYNNFTDAAPVADVSLKLTAAATTLGLSVNMNGSSALFLDSTVKTVALNQTWQLFFGGQSRQMVNLWSSKPMGSDGEYGIGVQNSTTYFRSAAHFGWHRGGIHSDALLDAGTGGKVLMSLNSSGDVTNPSNVLDVNGRIRSQSLSLNMPDDGGNGMSLSRTNTNLRVGLGTSGFVFGGQLGFTSLFQVGHNAGLVVVGQSSFVENFSVDQDGNGKFRGDLTIATGILRPSKGSGENGIVFPLDPGGGSGDRASIQYFARAGENTVLEIKNQNDAQDNIEITASGSVVIRNGIVSPSDERLKKNIQPLVYGLEQIKKLFPVSYDWKDQVRPKKSIGLLAQNVESVINEAIYENKKGVNETELCLSYNTLIPVLINAVKELDQKLEAIQLKFGTV